MNADPWNMTSDVMILAILSTSYTILCEMKYLENTHVEGIINEYQECFQLDVGMISLPACIYSLCCSST